jgi:hypothetical protein
MRSRGVGHAFVSDSEGEQEAATLTRRRLLFGGGAVVGAAAVGVGLEAANSGSSDAGAQPTDLPARQHSWQATLSLDQDGNPVAPRYDTLLFFDVIGHPTAAAAHKLEAALRVLERRFRWGPDGLLFTAGWGVPYFQQVLHTEPPIPAAEPLSASELPALDTHHLCLHLACDDQTPLAAVESALVHGAALDGADGPLDVSSVLAWRETRSGFVGAGLPAAHQNTGGIPTGRPVPPSAPLFMGFKSNLRKNQASEDAVTIGEGPFAGGTTMQVSYMQLRLEQWYGGMSERERVALMYAPQITPADVDRVTTDAKSDPQLLDQAIKHYGRVGHAQTSAQARVNGKPLILRRDFNTTDGGMAGLHFVSLQRTIADFVKSRQAMNASQARLENPAITPQINNGINEFIVVERRGNYILPPRARRSFPLLAA